MVLHPYRPTAERESSRADLDPLEKPPRCQSGEDPDHQSYRLGSDAHRAWLSLSLDRHRDLPSGRQARVGDGRLSAAQWPGPDKAHVPGDAGVQSADAATPAAPREVVGLQLVDDHWP